MGAVETPPADVASPAGDAGRYDAFLSYAREDSDFVVGWLAPALRARRREVWVDVDIPGGANWRERVRRGIEACKALIFVVTPASVASAECREELTTALSLNKLVIPLIRQEVAREELPEALDDVEWISLQAADDQDMGLDRLLGALEADLQWRDEHTRLAGRAREWLDSEKNSSYLLRGADLREAERWLADQENHREAPTPEQGQYIVSSRGAAGRRLYGLIAGLTVALAITIGLTIFALVQRHTAIQQTHAAQSRALAAGSLLALNQDPELSLLLARQAEEQQHTQQALEALRSALAASHVRTTMRAPLALGWAWFTPDAREVVANGIGPSFVFDAPSGRLIRTVYNARYQRPMFPSQLSANGSHLVILPNIGAPVVMDVSGRAPPVKLKDPTDAWFTSVALSPNGTEAVAVTLHSHIARLYDTRTGRILRTFPGRFGPVAISPDGDVAALGAPNTITTYELASNAPLARVRVAAGGAYPYITFSPTGALYAVTATSASAYDPGSGRPLTTLQGLRFDPNTQQIAWPLSFSRTGTYVAGVTAGGQASVWNAATGQLRAHIAPAAGDSIFDVALSPNGSYLATADGDGTAHIWNATTAQQISQLAGVAGGVGSVVWAPDGTRVLTAGEDGTARIWDAGLGLPTRAWAAPDLLGGPGETLSDRWSFAQFPTGDRTITMFNSVTGRTAFTVHLSRPAFFAVPAAEQPVLAVTYQDAPVDVYNLASGRLIRSIPGTSALVSSGARVIEWPTLSADGRRILIAQNNTFTVYDVSTGNRLGELHHAVGGLIPQAASTFSANDDLIATVGTDGVVLLWRASTGQIVAREMTEASPGFNASVPVSPAFSADGSLFTAAGNWDRSPGVWRTSDGQLVSTLSEAYQTVAFSPTGPLIVTGGGLVWDATSGRLLLTLHDPQNVGIDDAVFSPNGLNVIGSTASGRELFPCDVCGSLSQLLALANRRTTRPFTAAERNRYLR